MGRFDLQAQVTDTPDQRLFLFPLLLQACEFRLDLGPLLPVFGDRLLVLGAGDHLALEDAVGDIELLDPAVTVLDRRRRRRLAHVDPRTGGIEQADRFVRQLPAGDVAVRQPYGLHHGLIENAHAVMLLQRADQSAHHLHGHRLARLLDLDDLEAPGQRRIALEVLLVFGPGGGGDGPQLAAGQRRLQQVGGVALAGLAAGADHRVRFVDEQDDRLRRGLDLLDHRFQPVFELALHPGARLQQPEVERAQRHVLQRRRHVAGGNAQGKALHHRRLTDAGLTGHDRVVLAAPGQDIDNLPDLVVAAEHRVDLAVARPLGQVDGELVERGGALGRRGSGPGRRRRFRRRFGLGFAGIGGDRG